MKKLIHKIRWKKIIKFLIFIAIIGVAGLFVYHRFFDTSSAETSAQASYTTEKVSTRTIQNTLSGSGTIEPLNTYEVTTLVQGTIISANFEEGDQVEKGQVLYQISTDDVDSEIETAQTKVERAEKTLSKANDSYSEARDKYDEAVSDYEEAKDLYGDPNVLSTETGIVKTLYVKEGDTIQKGSQIAEIYNNSYMLLSVPFSSAEADASLVGNTAEITIEDSFETLEGKVTKVSAIEDTLSGNRVVKYITIKVKNPGGITASTTATATIGDISSMAEGTFSVLTDTVISSEVSGEIGTLNISEGSSISEGDVILALTQESIDEQLESYSNAVDSAENTVENTKESIETAEQSLEDAETNLDDVIDSKTDYSITAPISGEIVRKNALTGDTIGNNSSTLCYIYDLSSVTFSMYVDELDIGEVEVGQEVNITADALEDAEITGKVTNISLISSASSGVTQYPVTVQIDDVGDLLPGMNVTGDIVVEEAENCLAIPSDALQRGNIVYVKDNSAVGDTQTDTSETVDTEGDASQTDGAGPNPSGMPENGAMPSGMPESSSDTDDSTSENTMNQGMGDVPDGFKAVTVTTGLTDGDYIQITSGLDGTEEVYIARAISSEAASGEESLLDSIFGGSSSSSQMPSGNFSSGGSMGGGSSMGGGGSFGGGNSMGGGLR